ncbi:hypothetical protein Tco_1101598 [Tanacetum coccineum]
MHQFWNNIKKIKDTDAYQFKLDKKKCRIDTEVFREILQICLILPDQEFVKPPSKDEIVSFIKDLGYSGKCEMLFAIHTDKMTQPWRTFAAIINRCISGKTTCLYRLRLSRAQILWDSLLGRLKFVSKIEDYQKYGALIHDDMINQDIKYSEAYKTYLAFATRQATPKKARKLKKIASPSKKLSPILEEELAKKSMRAKKPTKKSTIVPKIGVVIRDTPGVSVSKKKAPTKVDRGKGMDLLSDVALLEADQLKKALKKNKGTGTITRVPDVPKYQYESENESWGDSDNNDDEDVDSDVDSDNEASDSEKTNSDDDENPTLNLKDDEEEEDEEEYEEEYVHT